MRILLVIPVSLVLAAACGFAVCAALHINPHAREMLLAVGACFVASELALVPTLLTRGAEQPAVAQAGLLGTVIHLLACSVFGGALLLLKPLSIDGTMVYWLLGMYWVTLIVLSTLFVRVLRSAPPAQPQKRGEPAHSS
jgi:hypothetical protein